MSLIFRKIDVAANAMRNLFLRIFNSLLSVLIGWGISHVYYLKALDDVQADAEERRRVAELVLRGIESIGYIKYSRDASGKVLGVVIELKGSAAASATSKSDLTIGHNGNPK